MQKRFKGSDASPTGRRCCISAEFGRTRALPLRPVAFAGTGPGPPRAGRLAGDEGAAPRPASAPLTTGCFGEARPDCDGIAEMLGSVWKLGREHVGGGRRVGKIVRVAGRFCRLAVMSNVYLVRSLALWLRRGFQAQ